MNFIFKLFLVPSFFLFSISHAYADPVVTINAVGVPYLHAVYAALAESFSAGEKSFLLRYNDRATNDFGKQIAAGKADFAVSDIALSRHEIDENNLIQVPVMVTAIVPVVNLPGIRSDQLVLDGQVLAKIMMGVITTWNHTSIKALNPNLNLPSMTIKPIARSDPSGSTMALTTYLGNASPEFRSEMGNGFLVNWPSSVRLVQNGLALESALMDTPGAITYIDMDEGNSRHMSFVRIKHHSGSVVAAGIGFLKSGVVGAKAGSDANGTDTIVPVDFGQNWPILLPIYVCVRQKAVNNERISLVLRFIYWSFSKGDDTIEQSGMVPLPVNLQVLAVRKFRKIESTVGTPLFVNFDL